jgi:hypothetical protein
LKHNYSHKQKDSQDKQQFKEQYYQEQKFQQKHYDQQFKDQYYNSQPQFLEHKDSQHKQYSQLASFLAALEPAVPRAFPAFPGAVQLAVEGTA